MFTFEFSVRSNKALANILRLEGVDIPHNKVLHPPKPEGYHVPPKLRVTDIGHAGCTPKQWRDRLSALANFYATHEGVEESPFEGGELLLDGNIGPASR